VKKSEIPTPARSARSQELPRMATQFPESVAVPGDSDKRAERAGTVRILLSQAASDALLAAGDVFVVAGRASHPDDPSRVALHFMPVTMELAVDACRVALGELRASKPNKAGKGGEMTRRERSKPPAGILRPRGDT